MLEWLGAALGPPAFATAGALYFLVTWTPEELARRDSLCGYLVIMGVGAVAAQRSGRWQGMRWAGALAMLLGAAAVAFC